MEEWDERALLLFHAFLEAVKPDIHVHSGLTGRVTQELAKHGAERTSGYELLEMFDWVEAQITKARS